MVNRMNHNTFNGVWLAVLLLSSTSVFAQNNDPASFAQSVSKVFTENNGKGICAPSGTTLKDVMLPLRQYMSQHPEKQYLTEAEIFQGLSQRFPCSTNSSTQKNTIDTLVEKGYSVMSISPIFDQLVGFSLPNGFTMIYENTNGQIYMRESVLAGESAKKWSQMITVTGFKNFVANAKVTPQSFANGMAGRFKNVCPTSFSGTGLGTFKLGSHDAFAAVISCGVAGSRDDSYSESTLLIVLKGKSDYYTIQWAERGDASANPVKFDESKWMDRFKRLTPIKLCPIVPGEPAPYPSCIGGGE